MLPLARLREQAASEPKGLSQSDQPGVQRKPPADGVDARDAHGALLPAAAAHRWPAHRARDVRGALASSGTVQRDPLLRRGELCGTFPQDAGSELPLPAILSS